MTEVSSIMAKICNLNFWIENDPPPPLWNFSENSSVLEEVGIPKCRIDWDGADGQTDYSIPLRHQSDANNNVAEFRLRLQLQHCDCGALPYLYHHCSS